MIGFKDFIREKRMLGLTIEPFPDAVERAGAWISERKVEVINVETLNDVPDHPKLPSCGVRVWYRTESRS